MQHESAQAKGGTLTSRDLKKRPPCIRHPYATAFEKPQGSMHLSIIFSGGTILVKSVYYRYIYIYIYTHRERERARDQIGLD